MKDYEEMTERLLAKNLTWLNRIGGKNNAEKKRKTENKMCKVQGKAPAPKPRYVQSLLFPVEKGSESESGDEFIRNNDGDS